MPQLLMSFLIFKEKMNFTVSPIGIIRIKDEQYFICLYNKFTEGLKHIGGFSHLQVIWWAHLADSPEARKKLTATNLFKNAPRHTGVFASRTPERPNPLMLSSVRIKNVDYDKGIIAIPFIDAEDGSPVLDIKPYYPVERIRNCHTPPYYSHWPQWNEDAGSFDWKDELTFDGI